MAARGEVFLRRRLEIHATLQDWLFLVNQSYEQAILNLHIHNIHSLGFFSYENCQKPAVSSEKQSDLNKA